MSIKPQTPGVHHVGLRVSDFARAKRFYTEMLGFPVLLELPEVFLFAAGGQRWASAPALGFEIGIHPEKGQQAQPVLTLRSSHSMASFGSPSTA